MPVYSNAGTDTGRPAIGSQLREQRRQPGWRLHDLAARAAVSVATLSAIENDKVSLTVDLLAAISRALDVPLDTLLPRSRSSLSCIARHPDVEGRPPLPMKLVNRTTGALTAYHNKLRPLAEAFVGKYIEPFEIDIYPVSDERARLISHHQEEFVFILRGEVEVLLRTPDGPSRETLRAGDCIHFWSSLPHCIRSTGSEPARALHVLCSHDQPADSEVGDDSGSICLVDAFQQNLSSQIGSRMVALRRARGMSTPEFARFLEISPRRLLGIKRGQRPISVQFLLELCRKCRKPQEYFLAGMPVDRPYHQVMRARQIRQRPRGRRARPPEGERCFGAVTFRLVQHAGQEFLYVLEGGVRLITVHEGQPLSETLAPGDSCFIDARAPHQFTDVRLTPYERHAAEAILVVSHRGQEMASRPSR